MRDLLRFISKTNLSTQLWIYLLRARIFLHPREQLTVVAAPGLDPGDSLAFTPFYFTPFFQPCPQITKMVANFVGVWGPGQGITPC